LNDAIQGFADFDDEGDKGQSSALSIDEGRPKRATKRPRRVGDDAFDFRPGEIMTEVHRDDEFVYPSLDMSDDEDALNERRRAKKRKKGGAGGRKGNTDEDATYTPKVQVRQPFITLL